MTIKEVIDEAGGPAAFRREFPHIPEPTVNNWNAADTSKNKKNPPQWAVIYIDELRKLRKIK